MTDWGTGTAGWTPAAPVRFLGRAPELEAIERVLAGSGRGLVVPAETAPVGVGTSELVFEYARRASGRYASVLHVHAGTAVQFTCELGRIARDVIDIEGRLEHSRAVRVLRDWLGCRSDWLLVVDGMPSGEFIAPLLDLGTGHLLATSGRTTAKGLPGVPTIEIEPLRPRHVVDDLARRAVSEIDAATDVARLVDYSPLGLSVAAAVVECSGGSWSRFREALVNVRIDWLDEASGTESVLALAIDGLARVRPAEMKLLCALATFTPTVVPLAVLESARATLGRTLEGTGRLRQLVDELVRWNLVRRVQLPVGDVGVSIQPHVRLLLLRSLPEASRRRWTTRSFEFATSIVRDEDLDALDTLPLVACAARRALDAGAASQLVADVANAHETSGFALAAEGLRTELLAKTNITLDEPRGVAVDRAIAEAWSARGRSMDAARRYETTIARVEELLTDDQTVDEDRGMLLNERARLRIGLGLVHRRLGRFAESSRALEPVLDAADVTPVVRASALRQFALLEIAALRWDSATESLARAANECDAGHDPIGALDVETTMCSLLVQRRALDEAGSRIDVLLDSIDRTRTDATRIAALWRMRAGVHRLAGRLTEAENGYRRALAIDEIARGVDGREVALDRAGLAAVSQARGDHVAAVGEFERAAKGLDGLPDGDLDDSLAVVLARLCRSLLETGDTSRAADISQTALKLRSRRPFARDLELAEILESRALVLVARRRHVDAIPYLKRAIGIVSECAVAPDLEARSLRFALAVCLVKSGHLVEAETELEQCVDLERRRLETDSSTSTAELVRALLLSADRLERQEDFEAAESVLEEIVGLVDQESVAPSARHLPGVLRRLARVQRLRQRFAVARRSIDRSLELLARGGESVDSPSFVRSRLELARLHADRRGFDEARAVLDDVATSLTELDQEGLSSIEFERGLVEMAAGRRGAARRNFESAFSLREQALGEKHVSLIPCHDELAGTWLGEQPERALEHARRAVFLHDECRVPDLVDYANSLERLGRALHAAGALREAVEVLEGIPAIREKSHPPDQPINVAALGELGIVLMKLERPDEAVPLLEQAVHLLERRDGERVAVRSEPSLWLARAQSATGRHNEAIARITAATEAHRRGADETDDRVVEVMTIRERILRHGGRSAEADAVRDELATLRERRENVLF